MDTTRVVGNDPLIAKIVMERHLSTGVATIVALMAARQVASGRADIRSSTVEKILLNAEADFAAEHVAPRDVVGDWLLSLAQADESQASSCGYRGAAAPPDGAALAAASSRR